MMLSLIRPMRFMSLQPAQAFRLMSTAKAAPTKAAAPAAGGKAGAAAPAAGGKGASKAAAGKGKGGKGGDKAGAPKSGPSAPTLPAISTMTDNIVRGVNVLKGKSDPLLLPDSEYPPWLWQFVGEKDDKLASLVAESESKLKVAEAARLAAVGSHLDLKGALLEQRKQLRKSHKKEIREQNFLKAKKR